MCLYETEMQNPKYTVNKKNKGIVPRAKDKRLTKIKGSCGWCIECRKQIARNWLIRLNEELKSNKKTEFVTLSLSVESIIKLEGEMYTKKYKGISENIGETDVNLLASFAIRRWTERWRKHNKMAPRHFLITELGHTNSERIHLHGLVWGSQEMITRTWQYGNIKYGDYVNGKTVNYITKYITKIDKKHIGYKQAIFVSKGMGKDYIERNRNWHKFKGKETKTKYRLPDGREIALPRYYKEKIWNEEEREELYLMNLDENKISLGGEIISKDTDLAEFNQKLETVRENNKRAGYGDNKTVIKKYIITEAMKTHYKGISDKLKKVKSVNKRHIDKITPRKDGIEPSKSNNCEYIHYGEYIGTTTESQRKYNELLREAKEKQITVKTLRLIKAGIITYNQIK